MNAMSLDTFVQSRAGHASTDASANHTVCIAPGDGIGPEIMLATLTVLREAGAPITLQPVELGLGRWHSSDNTGIPGAAWSAISETGVLLKGPMAIPQGSTINEFNVAMRRSLGLFANVRPVRAYAPFLESNHPETDLVIIRDNEEDAYTGIEHQQTDDVVQCLKLVSRTGCERIVRYAFEFARSRNRSRVTCMTKDNILKLTDGLFHKVFRDIAAQYPDIVADHMIVDLGLARVARDPSAFDVIVTPNLYGDIVSDIAAEVTASLGLAQSANIGEHVSVFEPVHGSAHDIAGRDIANPSGLLLSAVKMLAHLGEGDTAELVHNAWLATIEDGLHTADVYRQGESRTLVGTGEFAQAVIRRLGVHPQRLKSASYPRSVLNFRSIDPRPPQKKQLVGVDIFVDSELPVELLAEKIKRLGGDRLALRTITNRGVQVWPQSTPYANLTDHWRCRFVGESAQSLDNSHVTSLLLACVTEGVEFIKTEHLYEFDGSPGFSLAQG